MMEYELILQGVLGILMGYALLRYKDRFVEGTKSFQNRAFHISYSDRDKKFAGYVAALLGVMCLVGGIASLVIGIIRFFR